MAKPESKHLKLVETAPKPAEHTPASFEASHGERTLFASRDPSFLIFADFEGLSEVEFLSLLVSANPTFVIDLRLAPRFDVGTLNRKLVFSMFENVGARYFDMSGLVGVSKAKEVGLDPIAVAGDLKAKVFRAKSTVIGPVLFLVAAKQASAEFMDALVNTLDELSEVGWQTMRVPAVARARLDGRRPIVFISHATPDDNEFVRWLSTQLTLVGYEVWADFDRLRGGELFWDTIEDIIRNRAAKFVIAASRLAQSRSGVLDEIALAVSIERSLGLDGFVIPLKIDDFPFSDFRANIARKNILDFSDNWSTGLTALLRALDDARVPKGFVDLETNMASIVHGRLGDRTGLVEKPDPLLFNWLEVECLPVSLSSFSVAAPSGKLQAISKTLAIPHVPYGDMILTQAKLASIQANLPAGITAKPGGSVLTSEFLKGQASQFPNIGRSEARRMLVNLIRQGWERFAASKGLRAFQMSSGSTAWFFRDKQLAGNKVTFTDAGQQRRRKSMVGFSPKRNVYWHFAVEMRVAPGSPLRLIAKPHVIFTENGNDPLDSASRMHALRRGFCKNWWNDRWRDLLVAYLSWLSDEKGMLVIDMGGDHPLLVSSRLMEAACPVAPDDEPTDYLGIDIESDEEPEECEPEEDELPSVIGASEQSKVWGPES